MSARRALGLALADLYRNSWRLVPVNAALGAVLVFSAVLAIAVHALLVLAVLAGPLAAALAHCSVTVVRTGNLVLADAWEGLCLHWRRGLALGAAGVRKVMRVVRTLARDERLMTGRADTITGAARGDLGNVHEPPAALQAVLAAGGLDQDAPHRLRGGGEEVAPASPAQPAGR